ncbi:hypothetical protein [Paenibacillus sp. KS-LC4]|uniref:hypothetical protein n=1 Tax=Paenibacillus sp. KS-LC4 TaxID=2979727 RepID=UPI0030CDC521
MDTGKAPTLKTQWIPAKDRKWVLGAVILSMVFVIWELWSLAHLPSATVHNRRFEHTFKDFGSNARIALFLVLANYVLLVLIKLRIWDQRSQVKKGLATLLRFARRWHTPIAIIAIAFILLHAVAVFMYGIKLDFSNITGLLALLMLLPVPVSGLFRYKRLDRKWHLRSGLAFTILFLIHAFL